MAASAGTRGDHLHRVSVRVQAGVVFIRTYEQVPVLAFVPGGSTSFAVVQYSRHVAGSVTAANGDRVSAHVKDRIFQCNVRPVSVQVWLQVCVVAMIISRFLSVGQVQVANVRVRFVRRKGVVCQASVVERLYQLNGALFRVRVSFQFPRLASLHFRGSSAIYASCTVCDADHYVL